MPVEPAAYIDGLNTSNPGGGESAGQGAAHLRLIKGALKATFPNITGAVQATQGDLNGFDNRIKTFENAFLNNGGLQANQDLSLGAHKLVSVADPTNAQDAATKSYVDGKVGGQNYRLPVSAILLTTTSANPAVALGYGTWTLRGQGLTLVGVGTGTDQNNTNKTFVQGPNAGEYSHALATTELPNGLVNDAFLVDHNPSNPSYIINGPNGNYTQDLAVTKTTGGGLKHNMTQPTFGVYIWERTA